MLATGGFAAIGFVDDYSKMAKKHSLGLTGRQKLLGQLLIAVIVWAVLFISTKYWQSDFSWNVSFPFLEVHGRTDRQDFYWAVPLSNADRGRPVGIFERCESDGRT